MADFREDQLYSAGPKPNYSGDSGCVAAYSFS